MTLFSMLFGIGLCIFFERASARGPGAMTLLTRRLLVLMAFGFAHVIFLWHADILASYAVSGLIALLLIRKRAAILLTVAIALLGGRALIVWMWPTVLPPSNAAMVAQHYQDALATYGGGSYLDVLVFRATEVRDIFLRFSFTHMPTELSHFLIGICIWRAGVLRHAARYRRVLAWGAFVGIAAGASFAIVRLVPEAMARIPYAQGELFYAIHSVFLRMFALGYGALLLLLLQRPSTRAKLLRLAPLGQMAFTNYLTQSMVFSTIFYGYGFGLLTKLGTAAAVLLGIAFYVVQAVVSILWLRRFVFGPFEWAWRCLTYGKLQPMRRLPRPIQSI